MGGLCYRMEDKILCGLLTSKEDNSYMPMATVEFDYYETALNKTESIPMDFTKRPMKGSVFIK